MSYGTKRKSRNAFGSNRSPKRQRKRQRSRSRGKTYAGYVKNSDGSANYNSKRGWTGANHTKSTVTGKDIDWGLIAARIPTKKDKQSKMRRMKMFNDFDVNGNGYLSLAELDKGIRDVLVIPQMFDMKPPILRAYYASKDKA